MLEQNIMDLSQLQARGEKYLYAPILLRNENCASDAECDPDKQRVG